MTSENMEKLIAIIIFHLATVPALLVSPEIVPDQQFSHFSPDERLFKMWGNFYGVRPEILAAMAHVESSKNPYSIERRESDQKEISFGLLQVGAETCRDFESAEKTILAGRTVKGKLFEMDQNIRVGAWQLSTSLKVFRGDYRAAVSAHPLGIAGLRDYRVRTGNRYYFSYLKKYERLGVRW